MAANDVPINPTDTINKTFEDLKHSSEKLDADRQELIVLMTCFNAYVERRNEPLIVKLRRLFHKWNK